MTGKRKTIRCAIYTRKSSDEGLDQDFNSLDAQREACEAYIKSQAHEGWKPLPDRFDDGGLSGGTMDRPALQRLMALIRARKVDVIVMYKIDRLTRSLADFARLAELFDEYSVSFVSITQQFNTTTSMGRLMLNVLLSFAQFEREVTGERIRDKIAASKKKGMWMGGVVPLGYQAAERTLVINEAEARRVRTLFRLYIELSCVRSLREEAERQGIITRTGRPFSRGHLYRLLQNPIYLGEIQHRDKRYPGLHPAIIDRETWDAVQETLAGNRTGTRSRPNARGQSPLASILVDQQGNRFTPSHTIKGKRRYRYYVDQALIAGDRPASANIRRIPSAEIERVVRDGIVEFLGDPARLLSELGDGGNAAHVDQVMRTAMQLREKMAESAFMAWRHIHPMIRRVVLEAECVRIMLNRDKLLAALDMMESSEPRDERPTNTDLVEIIVPASIRTNGVRLKLVIGENHAKARQEQDTALIKAVVRAHDWFDRLQSGKAASIAEIANSEGMTRSYVTRILRLKFLAPDIIEAILGGRHPIEATAERLTLRETIDVEWGWQRQQLGFDRV